jgi:transketolase
MQKKEYSLEQAAVNSLRVLACEAISNAGSGHSGIALSAAPILYAIYKNMKFDPSNPAWFNRDRFVMSAGHGSALLYATLKCFGVQGLDLKTFRTFNSPLSGHPELDENIGVDCSTGPLGQGIAMAVGVALAEKKLAAEFNREGYNVIGHHTFCVVGDGCLMEGASYEAANLAGLWRLNKLIVVYDCNHVTLDGTRESADAENVAARFAAMRWNVINVKNGNDKYTLTSRIKRAMTSGDAPTIIIAQTELGFGTKNAGSHKAHGKVLSADEIRQLREMWDITSGPFELDDDVREHFESIAKKKTGRFKKWRLDFKHYCDAYPKKHAELSDFIEKQHRNYKCKARGEAMAGRDAGHEMLNQIAHQNPRLWGGSADVASTTKAFVVDRGGESDVFTYRKTKANNIAYGVREFAMAAISNGLALHGFTPYCSTFLAFSDYCKPAMRMTALMNLPVTYIFTHDGIGAAQDGPTHQATEHIAALRLVPNMNVFRPADDLETAAVYEYVFEKQKPACIILGRGTLPSPSGAGQKNYDRPHAIIMASGGEVAMCAKAKIILGGCGVFVNVLSVPCIEKLDEVLDEQNIGLDQDIPVLAVELGSGMPWWALFGRLGLRGDVLSFDDFGKSGKEPDVMKALGFTPEQVADRVLAMVKKHV